MLSCLVCSGQQEMGWEGGRMGTGILTYRPRAGPASESLPVVLNSNTCCASCYWVSSRVVFAFQSSLEAGNPNVAQACLALMIPSLQPWEF